MRFAKVLVLVLAGWLGLSSTAMAAERNFGDWSVALIDDASAVYASTINDSGEVLGEYCYFSDGNCLWLMGMETTCKEGDTYLLLANSSTGAAHLKVHCFGALNDGKT
ncbi:MAG: hypothetical protein ACR2I8_09995, partial [Steroidobacteraceae bacterium]